MNNDDAYRDLVFAALRATTSDGPYAEQCALSTAVDRWAGQNGVGPVPIESLVRIADSAGYTHFQTERRGYFAGLSLKEDYA
ncbi:hypothetical protein N4G69_22200 [Streptomyces mirabilis]|uniref:hypothetical protein n=1 Tax=Streptomyces mirabilis TaxID=68239 RepID=UPI0021BF7645|nr:hypothetical protein [Streptomyces mirabilis]MCT9108311.1 hypothetical protein [Streptomyces mirabilis]